MMKSRRKLLIKNMFISICCVMITSTSYGAPSIEGIQVYQKNFHLSEERKQSLADDINRYRNADNLWVTLRKEFTLPHYEDMPEVQEQIQWLMTDQTFLIRTAARAAPYLYYILQQSRKRHLPAEVVLLPVIESAYDPFAHSSAGAAGIWQMMPGTASGYGIKQNWWYDGRRDVITSTKAALNYLVYLSNFFDGNWLLALAAYDTGEGNVLAAIRRNIRDGKSTNFWYLPLPHETRSYVPRLLALAVIIMHPEKYPLNFPPVRNAPYLAQIDIGGQIDLKQAAKLAGLSLKSLKRLNPAYNHTATDPSGPYRMILPIENVERFAENLARSPLYQRLNYTRYKIKSGDTLYIIARRFNTTAESILKINPTLAAGIKPGWSIVVPQITPAISSTSISRTILETQQPIFASSNDIQMPRKPSSTNSLEEVQAHYKLQPGDTLYMVRHGDTIEKIAKRFRIEAQTLLAVNQLNDNYSLSVGKQIIIPTHMQGIQPTQKPKIAPGDTIYMVRRGDSLEKVAEKFHTSPAAIRLSNLLANNNIQAGDRLVIPTHS